MSRRLGELVAEFRAKGLEDAGARARYAMVNECIERTLPPPDPARCDHCGGPEGDDMKLPLFDWSCRRWVHGRCVRAWQAGRRAEAAEARERFGVIHPDRRE